MKNIYIVVGNTAEHSGYIDKRDDDDCWCNENPQGWTNQDVTGPHGHILAECDTKKEAKAELDSFLECDSVEKGTYCYTHNPHC